LSGLFTSINPSYDLGWTEGTRVLTHPHMSCAAHTKTFTILYISVLHAWSTFTYLIISVPFQINVTICEPPCLLLHECRVTRLFSAREQECNGLQKLTSFD
jgi:hypothetical protein